MTRGRLLLGICVDESALGDGFKCGGKKHISQRKCQAAGFIIGLLAAAYGVYVFITRNFLTYMFLRNEFVFLDLGAFFCPLHFGKATRKH